MGFADDVKRHTDKYRKRMAYTAKTAALAVCNEARRQGPSVKNPGGGRGGRMPVDDGNLINSMVASLTGIPSGPATGNENKSGDDVAAKLIRWDPSKTLFYAGFPPKYARAMEYRYGFMRGAVERWGEFVRQAAAESIRRIP